MTRTILASLVAFGFPVLPHIALQAPQPATAAPAFDAATVRANNRGERGVYFTYHDGRFDAKNATLRMLIRSAYGVQDGEIVDAPDWVGSDHFDVYGKGDVGLSSNPLVAQLGVSSSRLQLMMQTLLAERFKLAVHKERRESIVYVLMSAPRDRPLGPGLRQSDVDCAALAAQARQSGSPRVAPSRCDLSRDAGSIKIGGRPIAQLVSSLANLLGRVVVDRTGLTGNFDVELRWAAEQTARGVPRPAAQPDEATVVAAVRDSLGLPLVLEMTSTEVLVIDHVERPAEQ